MGVMVVIAMAFIFAINTPEFWQGSGLTPPDISPLSLLIPFAFCLAYISLYPLIDFLFIALSSESDEGLTPFHKFIGNKIIHLSKSKAISVITAILLYLLFIIPPMLLSLAGLPFLVIWVSWLLAYPLMILSFYGAKGYVAGITTEFVHIPEIKRYSFLNYEDSKRGMKQFISNPKPYILFGLMLFVFVWAWISMFQTIIFFFSGSLAISTMTSYFVFVTLIELSADSITIKQFTELNNLLIISKLDNHSLNFHKLGREANAFILNKIDYSNVIESIRKKKTSKTYGFNQSKGDILFIKYISTNKCKPFYNSIG